MHASISILECSSHNWMSSWSVWRLLRKPSQSDFGIFCALHASLINNSIIHMIRWHTHLDMTEHRQRVSFSANHIANRGSNHFTKSWPNLRCLLMVRCSYSFKSPRSVKNKVFEFSTRHSVIFNNLESQLLFSISWLLYYIWYILYRCEDLKLSHIFHLGGRSVRLS